MSTVASHAIPAKRQYDAIVVGAGSGGLTVAVGLGRFDRQVLLVERKHMGGDCTNTGCVPSKSLLHVSRQVGGTIDEAAPALRWVRKRRDQLRDREVEEFGGAEGITFVYGTARLSSSRTVAVTAPDGTTWSAEADNIILATGSSARRVPIPGLPDECYLTNDELFELDEPPGHLAIVGAGAVGTEMALAFRRLGSEVTLIEAGESVLPAVLPEASRLLAEALVEQGVDIRAGTLATGYDPDSAALELGPSSGSGSVTGQVSGVDKVLVAVGRTPNTAGLGLTEIGVDLDHSGAVEIDARGRTSVNGVWALGDATTRGGATHFASTWGRRIIQSIVHPLLPIGAEPLRPAVVFTEPELATIGRQPAEVPSDVVRLTVDGSQIDRTYTDEIERSLLVVDVRSPTGEVLGATVVSPRAGEIIATFSLAMKTGVGFHRWYRTVIPYPTHAELITVAVESYLTEVADDFPGHLARWVGGLPPRVKGRFLRR